MRYHLEYSPNQTGVSIHVDHIVTDKTIRSFSSPAQPSYEEGERPAVVRDLFAIPGVASVFLSPYQVTIHKGSVFGWNEIIPKAISALQVNFDPMGVAVEVRPPKRHPPSYSRRDP